jgi:1,2-diacylglycerol-3-alpha-glucose alpha-1,2-glucosyltransferase
MSAGLPFQRKGLLDLTEIARENPEYKFIWFGASSIKNILPRKVKKVIENPPKNLIFPGFVEEEILLGAYSSANLFFFPTYEENEGIVVLEALAMKLPALLRDIPVYKNWLENRKTCFKGNNNTEFTENIKYIINNNTSEITEEAYKVAEERELSKIGMKYKEYYDYILSKN